MDFTLSAVALRVLGALIEKERTTPEYYPLTLNALTAACNQKSNRDPVVAFPEETVVRGLDELRDHGLMAVVTGAGSRVPKYRHNLAHRYEFTGQEIALLCVLMLRGAQTVGELRGRTSRMTTFTDLSVVEATIQQLADREGVAWVVELPRQAGQRDVRYAHLLGGDVVIEETVLPDVPPEPATQTVRAENERLAQLEAQLQQLREEFDTFKKQFE